MNIVKKNHYRPSTSFFDDFLTKDLFDWSGWTSEAFTVPKANIVETDEAFLVALAAPGIQKSDFLIKLDNNMLVIQADVKENDGVPDNFNYIKKEFSYQVFKRSFYLPDSIEMDKIEATYEDGVLRCLIPKKEEARKKPIRTIPIS